MAAIDKPTVGDPFDALLQAYRPVRRTATTTEAGPLPLLIPVEDLPPVDMDRLPGAVREFLQTGDAADGSRALLATSYALRDQGLTAAQRLSFMWGNDACREVALNHRRQDDDRALEYLWKHHAAKVPDCDPAADFADLVQPANDAPAGEAPAAPHRFKLLTGQDLIALPPLQWLVHGVLPAEGLATIYGPSASGKSFLAFDLSTAVAEGRRWYGHHVKARPVVYMGLEGEAGFRNRAAAWEQHHGRPLPAGFHMVLQPFGLTDPADVKDLAAAILGGGGHGALTIIDTLNRAAPTADENASKDMGLILEATKTLQRLTEGLVMLVHHTGKDLGRGMRGHSSMFAALDAAIEVKRDGDAREWVVAKAKDGRDGAAQPFRLEVVHLGTDEWGEPITSCVAVPAERTARPAKPLTPTQRLALDAFARAQGDTLRGVHVEAWRVEFYKASTADTPEAKKKQFQRVRQELVSLGRLTVSDDVYHQPGGDDFYDFLDEAGHGT